MLLWVKRVTLASVVFLVVIQIFRPAISNPPVDPKREIHASLAVEPAVATVLTRACRPRTARRSSALHPRIAVCVMLVKDGAGGDTAAPVAREVLEAGLKATR